MKIVRISEIDDPRVALFFSLKGKRLEREGLFIAEGLRAVGALLKSGARLHSCLVTESRLARFSRHLASIEKQKVPIYALSAADIEKVIGFRFHQGIMAAAELPKRRTFAELKKGPGKSRLIVALNNIEDPQNVGLIVRSSAALGVDAIVVDARTCDPYYRQAVRVSLGAVFGLPVAYETDLASALSIMKTCYGLEILAASPRAARKSIDLDRVGERHGRPEGVCLVLGNEDTGVSSSIIDIADAVVRIPMSKRVDSLNVACAGAVCIWHLARLRGAFRA